MALLALAVLSDSMLPNVQQRLLRDLGRPKAEVVYHTNWISALLTLAYVAYTGELRAAVRVNPSPDPDPNPHPDPDPNPNPNQASCARRRASCACGGAPRCCCCCRKGRYREM